MYHFIPKDKSQINQKKMEEGRTYILTDCIRDFLDHQQNVTDRSSIIR